MNRLYLFCGKWCKNIKKYFERANCKTLGPILLQKNLKWFHWNLMNQKVKLRGRGTSINFWHDVIDWIRTLDLQFWNWKCYLCATNAWFQRHNTYYFVTFTLWRVLCDVSFVAFFLFVNKQNLHFETELEGGCKNQARDRARADVLGMILFHL